MDFYPSGFGDETREIKWSRSGITTDSAGLWSKVFPGNYFDSSLPVVSIVPQMASGNYDWRIGWSGTQAGGLTLNVAFSKRVNALNLTIGTLLGINLLEASPGVVTFDVSIGEQTGSA